MAEVVLVLTLRSGIPSDEYVDGIIVLLSVVASKYQQGLDLLRFVSKSEEQNKMETIASLDVKAPQYMDSNPQREF